jgi:heme iron utilization protein
VENTPISPVPPTLPAAVAYGLLANARKASLGTILSASGAPFVSLVLVATHAGQPVFLLSDLALHSRNLAADSRVSLLLDGTDAAGDPMAGARVSLLGSMARTTEPGVRDAFLAQHPAASMYADFADFGFYKLQVASALLIQGFGRIVDIPGAEWWALAGAGAGGAGR